MKATPSGNSYFLVLLGEPMKFVASANSVRQALKDIVEKNIWKYKILWTRIYILCIRIYIRML